jgi:hypothetical protein
LAQIEGIGKSRAMPAGLAAVTEYAKTILISSRVEGIRPLSGILISEVDTGKSETLKQFHGNPGLVVLSDATSFGLINNLISDISQGKISHIVIPDLLKIMERSRRVASELIGLLNSLAEEGFTGALTYNLRILTDRPLYCGFLTALTVDRYHQAKQRWRRIGFSSRIIPLFFGYELEDLRRAQEDVLHERRVFHPIKLPKLGLEKVECPSELRRELKRIADFAAKVNQDFTAFRTIRNVVGFVKSHARLRGDLEVKQEDLRFLRSLVPFWFDPILGNDCDYWLIQHLPATPKELVDELGDRYSQATVYRRLQRLEEEGVLRRVGRRYYTTY